jgi:predicted DCC family thiol-disulfide oxidoreductase YuxK
MKHAWTGGQYSLWRAALGCALVAEFVRGALGDRALFGSPAAGVAYASAGVLLASALALGFWHRFAALVLAGMCVMCDAGRGVSSETCVHFAGLLVLAALSRPGPYLSIPAIGRIDPGGSWILPNWVYACAWLLLTATCVQDAARDVESALWTGGAPESVALAWRWLGWLVYLVPLAVPRRGLPLLWFAALATETWLATRAAPSPAPAILALGAAFDPAWIPPSSPRAVDTLFYDGTCGLCHRFVRFAIAEDRRGSAFVFAALDSERARERIPSDRRASLPDSVVVLTADGRLLVRSRAIRHALSRLGGVWRALAIVTALVPPILLDRLYDAVASVRHKLFARPAEACPLLPQHLRRRFDE